MKLSSECFQKLLHLGWSSTPQRNDQWSYMRKVSWNDENFLMIAWRISVNFMRSFFFHFKLHSLNLLQIQSYIKWLTKTTTYLTFLIPNIYIANFESTLLGHWTISSSINLLFLNSVENNALYLFLILAQDLKPRSQPNWSYSYHI